MSTSWLDQCADHFTVNEIKQGFAYDKKAKTYICVRCKETFDEGEIYQIESRFFTAEKALHCHLESEHPDYVKELIADGLQNKTITDRQKQQLELMADSESDKDIAHFLEMAVATVRRQRFMFREKAKQAKRFLAMYEAVMESNERFSEDLRTKYKEVLVKFPQTAKVVDDRFVITQEEWDHVLKTAFTSLHPLKLKKFSPKAKKKVVILSRIAEEFEVSKVYTEKEVNQILSDIYEDFVSIRRYLVDYGFFTRHKNGKEYCRVYEP